MVLNSLRCRHSPQQLLCVRLAGSRVARVLVQVPLFCLLTGWHANRTVIPMWVNRSGVERCRLMSDERCTALFHRKEGRGDGREATFVSMPPPNVQLTDA